MGLGTGTGTGLDSPRKLPIVINVWLSVQLWLCSLAAMPHKKGKEPKKKEANSFIVCVCLCLSVLFPTSVGLLLRRLLARLCLWYDFRFWFVSPPPLPPFTLCWVPIV